MRSVSISIDSRFAAVAISIKGEMEGGAIVDAIVEWFDRRPLAASLDRLYDATAFSGSVGEEDIRNLAIRLPEAALTTAAMTVIATRKPQLPLWSEALPQLAPARIFRVEPSLTAAWATLAIEQDVRFRDRRRRRTERPQG